METTARTYVRVGVWRMGRFGMAALQGVILVLLGYSTSWFDGSWPLLIYAATGFFGQLGYEWFWKNKIKWGMEEARTEKTEVTREHPKPIASH